MGWRDWLASPQKQPPSIGSQGDAPIELMLEGDDHVAAVGESHYQPALLSCCSAERGEEVHFICRAQLVPEPNNRYDPNAVAVQVEGAHVGYLARADAVRWQPFLRGLTERGEVATCEAVIAGRGGRGETPNLGIFLHLPPPAEARTQLAIGRAQRQGESEQT